ncbi:MAG: hypothetical protein ABUL62_33695 [Myxococcales bacterium]
MTIVRSLALSVFGALTLFVACGGDDSAPPAPAQAGAPAEAGAAGSEAGAAGSEAGAGTLGLFEAFERAQSFVRQSPDHLPAMAEAAVKTKDPHKTKRSLIRCLPCSIHKPLPRRSTSR